VIKELNLRINRRWCIRPLNINACVKTRELVWG